MYSKSFDLFYWSDEQERSGCCPCINEILHVACVSLPLLSPAPLPSVSFQNARREIMMKRCTSKAEISCGLNRSDICKAKRARTNGQEGSGRLDGGWESHTATRGKQEAAGLGGAWGGGGRRRACVARPLASFYLRIHLCYGFLYFRCEFSLWILSVRLVPLRKGFLYNIEIK